MTTVLEKFSNGADSIIDFTALGEIGKTTKPCRRKWQEFLQTDPGKKLLEEIKKQAGVYDFVILHDDNPEYTDPENMELYKRRFHLVLRKKGANGAYFYIDETPALAGDPHIQFRTILENEYEAGLDAVFGDISGPEAYVMEASVRRVLKGMKAPERGVPVQVIAPPGL